MKTKKCECHKQIVWFFEKPTVVVCRKCEKTIHYSKKECPFCGGKLSHFILEDEND